MVIFGQISDGADSHFLWQFSKLFWPVRNPNKNAINGHLAQGEADASEDEEHFWHSDILAFLAPRSRSENPHPTRHKRCHQRGFGELHLLGPEHRRVFHRRLRLARLVIGIHEHGHFPISRDLKKKNDY